MSNENENGSVQQEESQNPVVAEQQEVISTPVETAAETENAVTENAPVEAKTEKPALEPIPVTEEMIEKCKVTLTTMLDYLSLDGTLKADSKPGKINLLIASQDAGRIIGRKGQSLESLQILLNRMMQKGNERFPKIYIDIDGYSSNSKRGEHRSGDRHFSKDGDRHFNKGGRFHDRSDRFERSPRNEHEDFGSDEKEMQLRQQALDSAKEVRRWGEPVTLPPMNAHDRRIIHITLENEADLSTESNGEGNFKSVVISLKKEENA